MPPRKSVPVASTGAPSRDRDRASAYRGVRWDEDARVWKAMCMGGVLGTFDEEDDAARAYNAEALLRFNRPDLNDVSAPSVLAQIRGLHDHLGALPARPEDPSAVRAHAYHWIAAHLHNVCAREMDTLGRAAAGVGTADEISSALARLEEVNLALAASGTVLRDKAKAEATAAATGR